MQLNNYLAILGLTFDINGAYMLARGIVRKTNDRIRLESASLYGGYSPYLIGSGVTARWEGRTGLYLMIFGFTLQGSQYFIDCKLEVRFVTILISILGVFFLSSVIWAIINKYILPEAIARAKAPIHKRILTSMPNPCDLNRVGEALKLKRLHNESDREYWERLCLKIRRYTKEN